MTQTLILRGPIQQALACELIRKAPKDAVVRISPPKRSTDQNAKFWAMLSDISRAQPDGRKHPPETWKALAMHACGHAVQFETGLSGEPFPIGFRSSRLTKEQMSELIEFLYEYGARNGVVWSDETRAA